MKLNSAFCAFLLGSGLPLVQGLQCSSHDVLKKFQLDKYVSKGTTNKETPPSETTQTWWVNPCTEHKDNVEIPSQCNGNDILCGITEVKLPNKEKMVTQIIDFNKNVAFGVEEVDSQLTLTFKGARWGSTNIDAKIAYQCNKNMYEDEITYSSMEDNVINLSIEGPSGCLKDNSSNDNDNNNDNNNDNKDKNNKNKDSSEGGFSWFTWLIIYALLFTVIYLMIVSYMNTRGGSFDDFRNEFIERTTQFVTSLPTFGKEVAAKIFGSTSSSQRGGYSAV
ncbi:similar to Saccharomyces cerevisiae YJL178C ATG27 Type I membrane protein involved in autophagy and the cytoplasm-to-vacuole targeting (Cvt) pathway [Maudiozyma saulgeensis]|uniref:Autophagy-related protein 27 n=1 Tax=Maudiozyma saulgeensis TaxID=1789683 RepID=A0A1X7R2E9_9SACH|nr:similar to Saccharomyces cerevisiae YJL178C ATG27 Type I membrane protein involved in autophagy and the cytoplasm-to-vacuole targeting (Cvt) pathway [Kazachstania saulgeensis]